MTKDEKKRMIFVLDLWIENCESFYDSFKNDFKNREDAVKELECRLDRVHFLNEFLEEGKFITTDKYLEIADRYERLCDKFYEKIKG